MKAIQLAAVLLVILTGCRSRVVQITLINASQQTISHVIVDYPNAAFGVNALAPGETFLYTIKPLETGALKVQFTNAQGVKHTYSGPMLHKGDEGSIDVKFDQNGALANLNLAAH